MESSPYNISVFQKMLIAQIIIFIILASWVSKSLIQKESKEKIIQKSIIASLLFVISLLFLKAIIFLLLFSLLVGALVHLFYSHKKEEMKKCIGEKIEKSKKFFKDIVSVFQK